MKIYSDRNMYVNALNQEGKSIHPEGHHYRVHLTRPESEHSDREKIVEIDFHHGPVPGNNLSGVTNEALLAILIHRTKYLDSVFPCDENKKAIAHLEAAMSNFQERTTKRIVRGVEGQNIA